MTFAFISHAQPDKLRPDARMRRLVHFLHQAGIPVWIDRPEELGLDARALEDRCIAVSGTWTKDIRVALNQSEAGIGIWSLHANYRLREDPSGVLFQELNALAVKGRLHLVSIDPGLAKETGAAFKHLASGQQVIDLGKDDPSVLRSRLARLVESLASATKAKPAQIKPYLAALSDGGKGGGLGDMLQPERKRAREAALALIAAFSTHDPGRLPITFTPELVFAYEQMLGDCKRRNSRVRTYHRLHALMRTPARFTRECFDAVEAGLGERMESWLLKQVEKNTESYVPVDVFRDALSDAALALARQEGAEAADERHALLAILADPSGTVKAIRESIGDEGFQKLGQAAKQRRPRNTAFDRTYPLDGFDT